MIMVGGWLWCCSLVYVVAVVDCLLILLFYIFISWFDVCLTDLCAFCFVFVDRGGVLLVLLLCCWFWMTAVVLGLLLFCVWILLSLRWC